MNNYPDNVRPDDPLAPWNQDSFSPMNTGICFVCDNEDVEINERERCENCFYSELED